MSNISKSDVGDLGKSHMKIIHDAKESDLEISEKRINYKNLNIIKSEDRSEEMTDKIAHDGNQDTII